MRYLFGVPKCRISLPSGPKVNLKGYSDTDWAQNLSNRRSRTGFSTKINDGPIVGTSKFQFCTAPSTAGTKLNALSHFLKKVKWIFSILFELHVLGNEATTIFQDSLGTILKTESVQNYWKIKHVWIKYHLVRDIVETKIIRIQYIPSTKGRADSLKKAMIGGDFENHCTWLGVSD